MSLYNYVDLPNPNLVYPTTTSTCVHTFCQDCILRAIEHSPQCPIDRSPLMRTHLVPANPIVRSLVEELMVECVHRAEGCMYTCQRQHLANHLLDLCPYRESRSISTAEEQRSDESRTSPSISSVQAIPRQSPPTALHLTSRSTADTRLAALAEQNIILRQRVEGLEGTLHTFKREMVAIKRALGPWYQPGNGAGLGYYSCNPPALPHQTEAPLLQAPKYRRGRKSPPPTFEAARGSAPTRALRTSSNIDPHTVGSFHPHHAHTQSPMIAPLNLSTTLEGSLHGLRGSVVGLAASVDSMGRRHEIALTNETARMAEEVGGLRAGLHGLRMQIHAIMMDRNAQLTGRDGVGEGGTGHWMPLPAPPARLYHPQPPSITKL
ncbi:hypothetical protein L208DRAFT_1421926 [Tricholoma matsutake]|nr:hypothetical protein L208DRAFT_1421926 [Tricholoma matsutake 945]